VPYLQVLQENIRKGGPHGDAEGQTRDQPRNALAVHLPLLCSHTRSKHLSRIPGSSAWKVACSRGILVEGFLRVFVEVVKLV
jgi:hypothetical protein